jgi:hypothetical protein
MPLSGIRSIQRNVGPTRESKYYVAIAKVIKILNTKILKHTKLTTTKSQYFNIKGVKSKPNQVQQLFATVWIMHTNICANRM